MIHPEAIGICGSDYHFFAGELSEEAGGSQFPRVLGHEVGGTITAVGPDCRPELAPGRRVAVWPLQVCGHCYPCSVGRANNCENFQLIGIHVDGGMQELLCDGARLSCSRSTRTAAVAAMVEPVSVAVRAARRARIEPGEHVVVFGAGPIGQCICLRGARARRRGAGDRPAGEPARAEPGDGGADAGVDRSGRRDRVRAVAGPDRPVRRS